MIKRQSLSVVCALGGVLACAVPAAAQTTLELRQMSIQDLLNIPVTTAARVPEETMLVSSAVFVITRDDIVRAGARSIPEALRLAPGVQVSRINAGTWAVGIRGFPDRLARSMLVLIDGRAVYSPLFAGTYWETQDTLLNDIDRIEVIRGPGGTLWGANAVNGIINIITRRAADTQGWIAGAGGGNQERFGTGVRYGGTRGALAFRVYGKAGDRAPQFRGDGQDFDRWSSVQTGFRADWKPSEARDVTLQGDAYAVRLGSRVPLAQYEPPYVTVVPRTSPLAGGNLLARYHVEGAAADSQLQMYFDRTSRDEIPVAEARDTVDVDFQQSLRGLPRETLVWGAGYRVTSDRIETTGLTSFDPPRRTDHLFSAFLQDDIAITPRAWRLTVGSKIEHNGYSGVEVQPSVRLLWSPSARHAIFAAVKRAVRTPSRVETDYVTTSFVAPGPPPSFVRLMPDASFAPEKLLAYEVGYRTSSDRTYVTVSTFYNRLTDLLSTDLLDPFLEGDASSPRRILPVQFGNGVHGASVGGEITADAHVTAWLRVRGDYSYVNVQAAKDPGGRDVSQVARYEGLAARHQIFGAASVTLGDAWTADLMVRRVSALSVGPVPAYATADLRIGWAVTPRVRLSITGRNLLQDQHLEWQPGGSTAPIRRSAFVSLAWAR